MNTSTYTKQYLYVTDAKFIQLLMSGKTSVA